MFHDHVIEIRVLRDDVAVACAVCINFETSDKWDLKYKQEPCLSNFETAKTALTVQTCLGAGGTAERTRAGRTPSWS